MGIHFDNNDVLDVWAAMTVPCHFTDCHLYVPDLDACRPNRRRVVFLRSHILKHGSEPFQILRNIDLFWFVVSLALEPSCSMFVWYSLTLGLGFDVWFGSRSLASCLTTEMEMLEYSGRAMLHTLGNYLLNVGMSNILAMRYPQMQTCLLHGCMSPHGNDFNPTQRGCMV